MRKDDGELLIVPRAIRPFLGSTQSATPLQIARVQFGVPDRMTSLC